MRLFLTLFIAVASMLSMAQNWQMFPPGELRYYTNPIQHSANIQGIGFTEFKQKGDTTEIDLGIFSRYDTIKHGQFQGMLMQISTGNSNYGHKVIEDDLSAKVIFTASYDGRIKPDTMVLMKNRDVTGTWTVLENSTIKMTAKVASKLTAGQGNGDSLVNYVIYVATKTEPYQEKQFLLQVSKYRGITKSPVFYDLLAYPNRVREMPQYVNWKPYVELSKTDYLKVPIGTEMHFYEYRIGRTQVVKKRLIGYQGDSAVYNATAEGMIYYEIPNPNTPFVRSIEKVPFRFKNKLVKELVDTGSYIFNPIPNKMRGEDHYIERGYQPLPTYQEICGLLARKLKGEDYLEYSWYKSMDLDTMIYEVRKGSWDSIMHIPGIGLFKEHIIYPGKRSYREMYVTQYINSPNDCIYAEDSWRLTKLDNVVDTAFRIYPNPASNILRIDVNEPIKYIALYNLIGAEVAYKEESYQIDIGDLLEGIYVVRVQTETNQYAQKVVIDHP